MKIIKYFFLLILSSTDVFGKTKKISDELVKKIGNQIYLNECKGKPEYLVYWKEGEDVLSLGCGHFIWCPEEKCTFDEGFDGLRKFLISKKIKFPKEFLGQCPWKSAADMDKAPDAVASLRKIMEDTIDLQVQYIISKLDIMLPYIIRNLKDKVDIAHVTQQFNRLLNSGASGIYILIDYPHFKGVGTKTTEQYNGHRWGLLQILKEMNGSSIGDEAIDQFCKIAKKLLKQRVENAPRKEEQWLLGWYNRIDSYKNFN